jgi:hypothetical protein
MEADEDPAAGLRVSLDDHCLAVPRFEQLLERHPAIGSQAPLDDLDRFDRFAPPAELWDDLRTRPPELLPGA